MTRCISVPIEDLRKLLEEHELLQQRVTELQQHSTQQLEERRRDDLRLQVMAFHLATGNPVLDTPQVPGTERVQLRLRLIMEEAIEALEACAGIKLDALRRHAFDEVDQIEQDEVDLVALADALADLLYVIVGSELEFGIDGKAISREVHRSNMTKAGAPRDENGKVTKGENYSPPDIEGCLRAQGWRP